MTWRRPMRGLARVALLVSMACGPRAAPAPALVLPAGESARAGNVGIPTLLVVDVARSRGVAMREALDGLVQDALLAQAAKASSLERVPAVAWAFAAAKARLVSERLSVEARARGGPTDDELASVRVVVAAVRRSATVLPARAIATADAILRTTGAARDDEAFESLASHVPHPGMEVTVERLPEFDLTGRTAGGEEVDPILVAAAFALRTPGQTSDIVETQFGWHVVRLIVRVTPDEASIERRRTEVAGAAIAMRVRAMVSAALSAERRRVSVDLSVAAADQMAKAVASIP